MTIYNSDVNKNTDALHDTCPTCEARVRTTTPIDPAATYRLQCEECNWSIDLESAPARTETIVADGGIDARSGRDLLDQMRSDHAAKLSDYLDGRDVVLELQDILRPFDLAGDDLCIEVEHDNVTEYIWRDQDGFVALSVRPGGDILGPVDIDRSDLQHRISKPIEIRLTDNVLLDKPTVGGGR